MSAATELRELSVVELQDLLSQRQEEQFRLRMQHHTGQLERVSTLRQTRREIARIKTLLTERQTAGE